MAIKDLIPWNNGGREVGHAIPGRRRAAAMSYPAAAVDGQYPEILKAAL